MRAVRSASLTTEMTDFYPPSELPPDVAAKILLARDALTHYAATPDGMRDAISEAYHQLCCIADPRCLSSEPWLELEKRANGGSEPPLAARKGNE